MDKKYYWLLALPIVAFVVVVGLGVWKPWNKPSASGPANVAAQQGSEQPWLYPEQQVDPNSDQARRAALDEAIKKYRSASAFRSIVWRPYDGGQLKGMVDYVKPLRLHAVLEIPNQKAKSEIIIVGETTYVKDETGSWKIVNDADMKQFGRDFFAGMLVAGQTLESFGVADNAPITYERKKDKKCLEAKTKYQADDGLHDISFCFNDKQELVYVWMQASDGDVLTEYSDFNALISVERPPLPLLEHRIQLQQ